MKPRLELLTMGPVVTHSPEAVSIRPRPIVAAWPTMVTRSRCARALMRSTQKPPRHYGTSPFDGAGEHRAVGLGGGQRRWHGLEYSACTRGM